MGSLISGIPVDRRDVSLVLRSRKLVRENRDHQVSLRRMGWLGARLAPIMDDVNGVGECGGSREVREVSREEETSNGLLGCSE